MSELDDNALHFIYRYSISNPQPPHNPTEAPLKMEDITERGFFEDDDRPIWPTYDSQRRPNLISPRKMTNKKTF